MSKKLTLSKMNSIITVRYPAVVLEFKTEKDETIEITLDVNIGLSGESHFIDSIASGVFTDSGEYVPEYVDPMTFIAVIHHLSNMPIPENKDGTIDINACYEWMNTTDILGTLRGHSQTEVCDFGCNFPSAIVEWFGKMEKLISEKIEFKKQEAIARHQSDYNDYMQKLDTLIDAYSALGEKYAELDLDEMMGFAKSIAGKSEKEIASAVIDIRDVKPAGKKPTKNKKET